MPDSPERCITTYASIRDRVKTGHIFFFKGGEVISRSIARVQRTVTGRREAQEYTHVGIVILSDDFPIGHPYRLWCSKEQKDYAVIPYIFESTQSGPLGDGVSNVDGKAFLGTQLRRLDDVVYNYERMSPECRLGWGQLSVELTRQQREQVYLSFTEYVGIPYPISLLEIASTAIPRLRWLRRIARCCFSKRRMVCSELVAKVLVECNVLNGTRVHPEDAMPCDFIPVTESATIDTDAEIPVVIRPVVPFTTATVNCAVSYV
jgi:hypothetical protein